MKYEVYITDIKNLRGALIIDVGDEEMEDDELASLMKKALIDNLIEWDYEEIK